MLIGLLAGVITGALWGLTFVAPRAVLPFTELDLAVARYFIFGVISLMLMALPRFRPVNIGARRFWIAILLGGFGYVGYYIFVAFAVRLAGPAIPPLVIGALPIALAIYGNWQDRNVRWRALVLPLGLICLGLLVVNLDTLSRAQTPSAQFKVLSGTLCAFAAFAIWMVYGIINAAIMRAEDAPDSLVWTGLQGIGSMVWVLPIIPVAWFTGQTEIPHTALSSPEGLRFAGWALLLGIAGSWLATWCWVIASNRLPLALSAQLIVAETVFALIYGFAYDGHWPNNSEWLGASFLIVGVLAGVQIFTRKTSLNEPLV